MFNMYKHDKIHYTYKNMFIIYYFLLTYVKICCDLKYVILCLNICRHILYHIEDDESYFIMLEYTKTY